MSPKAPKPKLPRPPATLGKAGKAYWKTVFESFEVERHHVDLLESACHQLDRAESSRAVIASEGVTTIDRFGQARVHPAVEAERQAHLTFCKLQRELGLDVLPPEQTRGPRRPGTGV